MCAHSATSRAPLCLATAAAQLRGRNAQDEDRLVAARLTHLVAGREAHLLLLADGHGGRAAVQLAVQQAAPTLEALLQPLSRRSAAAVHDPAVLASRLQEALVFTVLDLQRQLAAHGAAGGCSLLLALVAGDVLTVASLGSSRCTLDVGGGAPLHLSADHRIGRNKQEQERLRAAGFRVALAPPGAAPPPPAAGDGVLRLWPGGWSQARSLGDFAAGDAVLPLPHVKQVVLPPSGGRLVLATRSVWDAVGRRLHVALRGEPLRSAAEVAIRAAAAASRDTGAGALVADVLPRGDSWQELCARSDLQHPSPHGHCGGRSSGKSLLRLLGLRRQRADRASEPPVEAEAGVQGGPKAELLADYDTAALLGLATPGGAGPTWGRSSSSLSSSSSTASDGGDGGDWADARLPPLWFTRQAEGHMRALLTLPHSLWAEARLRRQLGVTLAAEQAGAAPAVPFEWLTAAAAAVAPEGDLPPTPSSTSSSPAATPGPSALATSARPPRPAQSRSSLLAAAVAAARAGAAAAADTAVAAVEAGATGAAGSAGAAGSPALSKQPSLTRMDSRRSELGRIDEEHAHGHEQVASGTTAGAVVAVDVATDAMQPALLPAGSIQRAASESSSGGGASAASVDTLGAPRRRLPPLRTCSALEVQRSAARPAVLAAVPAPQRAVSAAQLDEQRAWLAALESTAGHFMSGRRRRHTSPGGR